MSYFVKDGPNDIEHCDPHDQVKDECWKCLRAALAEKSEKFPNDQCPSCGFPKDGPEVEGYIGMKSRAEAAESEAQKLRGDLIGANAAQNRAEREAQALREEIMAMPKKQWDEVTLRKVAAQAQEIKELTTERDFLQSLSSESGHKGHVLLKERDVLAQEIKTLREERDTFKKDADEYWGDCKAKDQEIKTLQDQVASLKREPEHMGLMDLVAEIKTLREELKK